MTIVIDRKNPFTHSIKVALGTIAIFVAVGLLGRFLKSANQKIEPSQESIGQVLAVSNASLVPSIQLRVSRDSHESSWITALAGLTGGQEEVSVDFGRADVITDNYAVEVDFLRKWKEGLGQAQHYADVTDLIPVLALIALDPLDEKLLEQIDGLCTKKGVKVILLRPFD